MLTVKCQFSGGSRPHLPSAFTTIKREFGIPVMTMRKYGPSVAPTNELIKKEEKKTNGYPM